MSNHTPSPSGSDWLLKDYQRQFLHAFLDAPTPHYHALLAAPGTGKTAVAAQIVRAVAVGPSARILVVAPKALEAQWSGLLTTAEATLQVMQIDRARFRELQSAAQPGSPVWPTDIVAIVGRELCGHEDVAAAIATAHWDLVVVDEAQGIGRKGGAFLRDLVVNKRVDRVLLVTTQFRTPPSWVPGLVTTNWEARVAAWFHANTVPRVSRSIHYRREAEEVVFLDRLQDWLDELPDRPPATMIKRTLLSQAASSVYAVEEGLISLRSRLMRQLDLETWLLGETGDDASADVLTAGPLEGEPAGLWPSPREAADKVSQLLLLLEKVPSDAKLRVFQELMEHDISLSSHASVFTRFRRTADYLHTALRDRDLPSWRVTGAVRPQEVSESLREFNERGGVLIATDAILVGMDLRAVEHAVFYDDTGAAAGHDERLGRLWRIGRERKLHVYTFDDDSGAIRQWAAKLGKN